MNTVLSPTVRRAISALDHFGVANVDQAKALLRMWAWRDELSADDVALVLAYYPDRDDQADDYERDDQETGEALPSGVQGYRIGGGRY